MSSSSLFSSTPNSPNSSSSSTSMTPSLALAPLMESSTAQSSSKSDTRVVRVLERSSAGRSSLEEAWFGVAHADVTDARRGEDLLRLPRGVPALIDGPAGFAARRPACIVRIPMARFFDTAYKFVCL